MKYWYNMTTGRVESDAETSRKDDLMGPYPTAEEAARALDIAREKTEAWDEEDRRLREEEGRD